MQIPNINQAKGKERKSKVQAVDFDALLSTDSKDELKKIATQYIKPISFKDKQELEVKLRDAAKIRYNDEKQQYPSEKGLKLLLNDIEKINFALKDVQVSTPTIDSFNSVFIDFLAAAQKNNLITNVQLLQLWQFIPFKNLSLFLNKLNLDKEFKEQDEEKFTKCLVGLAHDNKIPQCCVCYMLYHRMQEFEDKILVPKLIASDQIYNPIIIDMFKNIPEIKLKVVQQIDAAKAVIILEHLQEDPRNYPHIERFILRKHYKSMTHEYSEWFVYEDKMNFNPIFIEWYCEEQDLEEDIKQSLRFRNGLGGKEEKVSNPLFTNDFFGSTQEFLHTILENNHIKHNAKDYASLSDYGMDEKNVHFINDSSSQQFDAMINDLLACRQVGFDAQYRCTSTKYEQLGVSIIQMSTGKQIYIIDFIKLESDQKFIGFFKELLSNPDFLIIGHSIQSDIKFIERTMKVQALEGTIDIAKIFKEKFPNETQNSLAFMTGFMTGKELSKYEQRSNWNRRPLKKTQSHYAALDAQMCLVLYQMLKSKEVTLTEAIVKNKKKTIENLIRKQNIVYKQHQEDLIYRKIPKFLIDSMLKRLCSLLRNLGIDAEYMAVSNYELMQEIATKQDRIILTRDRKLLNKKSPQMPIYCIAEKGDSDSMLQQIKREFKIDFSQFQTLSRCVKCNCPQLQVIGREQAMQYVNFQYEDNQIQEYWKCQKCKQIYWEGNQYKSAKKRFKNI